MAIPNINRRAMVRRIYLVDRRRPGPRDVGSSSSPSPSPLARSSCWDNSWLGIGVYWDPEDTPGDYRHLNESIIAVTLRALSIPQCVVTSRRMVYDQKRFRFCLFTLNLTRSREY